MPVGRPPAALTTDRLVHGCRPDEASTEQRFRLADAPEVPDHLAADAVDGELVTDGDRFVADPDPPIAIVSDYRDLVSGELPRVAGGFLGRMLPHTQVDPVRHKNLRDARFSASRRETLKPLPTTAGQLMLASARPTRRDALTVSIGSRASRGDTPHFR